MKNQRKSIEEYTRDLPVPDLPDEVWDRVEEEIMSERPSRPHSAPTPWFRYAIAACLTVAVLTVAWMMFQDFRSDKSTATNDSPLIESANDDLDMAIMYYERAIGKLQDAAGENESDLNPEILALYTEKISLLKQSIAECKQALRINRNNPTVRTQLFASYTDLQSTYESLAQSEHTQHYGN